MQHDEKQLHQIAQDYPWYMFTVEEIAILCNVSRDVVSKVRASRRQPVFPQQMPTGMVCRMDAGAS